MSFHIMSNGIKKKLHTKQKKIKNNILVLSKTTGDDDGFRLKTDSSSSMSADEAKKEIGRKLGIIFDDELDVNSKDGTGS
ncbi:hypothetical protein Tco_1108793 [Tanacetum coccineum]